MIETSHQNSDIDRSRQLVDPDLTHVYDLTSTQIINKAPREPAKPEDKPPYNPNKDYEQAIKSYDIAKLDGRHSPGAVAVRAFIQTHFPGKPFPK